MFWRFKLIIYLCDVLGLPLEKGRNEHRAFSFAGECSTFQERMRTPGISFVISNPSSIPPIVNQMITKRRQD